jgi:hypothetical protein
MTGAADAGRSKSVILTPVRLASRRLSSSVAETPFEVMQGFNERWWNRLVHLEGSEWFSFLDAGGTEAARAECVPRAHVGSDYAGVCIPEDGFVEIAFLEIREGARRQDADREVVRLLQEAHPGRSRNMQTNSGAPSAGSGIFG